MLTVDTVLNVLSILVISLGSLYLIIITCYIAVKAHQKSIVSGEEALIGMEATVLTVHHDQITVRLLGEIWQAQAAVAVRPHQRVKIIKSNGLLLTIQPIEVR